MPVAEVGVDDSHGELTEKNLTYSFFYDLMKGGLAEYVLFRFYSELIIELWPRFWSSKTNKSGIPKNVTFGFLLCWG